MWGFFKEYGLFIVSCLGVACFLFIFKWLLISEQTSLVNSYTSARVYQTSYVDGKDTWTGTEQALGIDNSITGVTIPRFVVSPSKEYVIKAPSNDVATYQLTRDMLMDGVSAFCGSEDITASTVVVVTQYIPEFVLADNSDSEESDPNDKSVAVTGKKVTEEVMAIDKFGNIIKDSQGHPILTTRVKYQTKSGVAFDSTKLKSDDLTNYGRFYSEEFNGSGTGITLKSDYPYKFKVVYRVTKGTMKAEFTALFSTEVREQHERADELYDRYFKEGERNEDSKYTGDQDEEGLTEENGGAEVVNLFQNKENFEVPDRVYTFDVEGTGEDEGSSEEGKEDSSETGIEGGSTENENGSSTVEGEGGSQPTPTPTPSESGSSSSEGSESGTGGTESSTGSSESGSSSSGGSESGTTSSSENSEG